MIANRYKSVPVEIDEYFLQLIRYVHQNPIKAGVVREIADYPHSSYVEYTKDKDLTDTVFLFEMISKNKFIDYHKEVDNFEFRVTDSKRKTDEDVLMLKKHYGIDNAKSIAKLPKAERDSILADLKGTFSVRQLQRITGVSRGVITRAE